MNRATLPADGLEVVSASSLPVNYLFRISGMEKQPKDLPVKAIALLWCESAPLCSKKTFHHALVQHLGITAAGVHDLRASGAVLERMGADARQG